MSDPTGGSPVQAIRYEGTTVIVEIAGDINLRRSSAFQEGLLSILDGKPDRIVVDLAGVPYMDSSGVASLVKLLSRTRHTSLDLRLAGMNPRVRSIFEITHLDSVFTICDNVREATA